MDDGGNPGDPEDDDAFEHALAEIAAMDPKLLTNDHPTPVSEEEITELIVTLNSIPDQNEG